MSDLRDTIAVNSPSSAPRRGQKRGAASSTAVPVSLGSKRRPVQKYCVVQLIAVPKKPVSVSLFFIPSTSYSLKYQWVIRSRFNH